ncbi:probable pectinesterase 29 [Herrania umbratica]|uniref:Pectinesterase n=1 Tax=Herrania umbratica TaxID=108875 RepID=A0A6J1AWX8_9ROSI|nr:probable pectinesterase 29 [Herrania umbratica]
MMPLLHCRYCLFIALLLSFQQGSAEGRCQKLLVDQSGHGNFSTIQSAINHVPHNNRNWFCIHIKAGTYREKVKIPYDKPFIILKGAGKRATSIVWDDHQSLLQSPTFSSLADNIVVKSMSFVNSYNSPNSNNPRVPAVAAMVAGDKSFFYKCGFFSLQDTLWDDQGRHYFKRCTIEGAVDFIFGSGQSIYEDSAIHFLGGELEPGLPGFITAQGRTNPNDANGFVFKNCNVLGSGTTFLGRPWRGYSRVLFYNCKFSDIIQPGGWDAWSFTGYENQLTFVEYGNHGPGSDTSKRVSWEKKLSVEAVEQLTSMTFIDSEGWLQSQPV